jgi:RHS repeat-associated protein
MPIIGLLKAVTELKVPAWDSVLRKEVIDSQHTGFAVNTLGNVVSDTSPMKRVTRYTRDAKQRVTNRYDAAGHRTEYVFDELNRTLQHIQHVEQAGAPGYPADPGFTTPRGKYAGGTTSGSNFSAERQPSADIPGVSFFRTRVYDQTTGRWTQEDPVGVAGGLNLYQFNGNNPAAFTDPFGLNVCFTGTREEVAELRAATENATNRMLLLNRSNCVVSSVSRGNESFDRIRGMMFEGLVKASATFTVRYTRIYTSDQISKYFIDVF